jgi:glycosyltransferase involved in cell wall biosynthesis
MKICMLARGLPPDVTGGMEVHTQELIKGLRERGHKVTLINLITPNHPEGSKVEIGENFRVFFVGDKPRITVKFHRDCADLIKELNAEENFDVVHSQEVGYGYGFARFSSQDIPFVVTMHGVPMTEIRDLFRIKSIRSTVLVCRKLLIYKALYRHLFPSASHGILNIDTGHKVVLNRADKVIAVGSRLLKDIKDQYGISHGKLTYIPNGIDTERFRPQTAEKLRARWDLSDGPVILAPGRIDRYKGFDILMKAFPAIKERWNNAKLFIVGEGPFLADLKNMSQRIGIGADDVTFTGKIPYQDMPLYYNLADVVVFPTMRSESFGLVAAEAMACGKAVIASRIGEIPEFIVDNKDGVLVKPGDVEDLKKKILAVLEDKGFAAEMGERARAKISREFSLDSMVERTIDIYKEVSNAGA